MLESAIHADKADPILKKGKYAFMKKIKETNIKNMDELKKFINSQSKENQDYFNFLVETSDITLKSRVAEKFDKTPNDTSTIILFDNIFKKEIQALAEKDIALEKIKEKEITQEKETEKMFNIANSMYDQ